MTKTEYLNEEEITASKVALAVSASIGAGGDCPDKWVMEWLLALTEKRLKAIKTERLAEVSANVCRCENPGPHFKPGAGGKFCAVCGKDILSNVRDHLPRKAGTPGANKRSAE